MREEGGLDKGLECLDAGFARGGWVQWDRVFNVKVKSHGGSYNTSKQVQDVSRVHFKTSNSGKSEEQ